MCLTRLPLLAAALGALALAGCARDAPPEATTLPDSAAVALPTNTVLTAAREAGLSTFETLVVQAGLDTTLHGEGPLTVFAPTNAAFEQMPTDVEGLLDDARRDELVRLLRYHLVAGRLETTALPGPAAYETVLGPPVTLEPSAEGVTVTDAAGTRARVVTPDLNRGNGVLHVIDAVLMPPEGWTDSTAAPATPAP